MATRFLVMDGKIVKDTRTGMPVALTDNIFTNVTYETLKTMRDNGHLLSGEQYRIVDFVTTTSQPYTQSAGHPFDIIVVADSPNTLNENARAVAHEGDTYFANCKLSAWEIKYCLDNDKTRFWWASNGEYWITSDFANGKVYILPEKITIGGQEYFRTTNAMIFASVAEPQTTQELFVGDENGVISFEDDEDSLDDWGKDEAGKGVIYYMKDEYDNECPYDFKNIQTKRWQTDTELENDDKFYSSWEDTGNDFRWCYTFMANGTSNDTWADASTINPYRYMSDENTMPCVNNTIKPFIQMYEGSEETNSKEGIQWLNNIVLYGSYEDNPIFSDNYEYNYIKCPCGNKFGINNLSMTLGKELGGKFNTFGNYCDSITFGNYCESNTFGNYCHYNIFGNSCHSNTFGNYCCYNIFGDSCNNNTFGNSCTNNTFGNYCYYNIVDSGVEDASPQPTTGELPMQGVHIHYGVKRQFTVVRGVNYTQDVRTANDVTITV